MSMDKIRKLLDEVIERTYIEIKPVIPPVPPEEIVEARKLAENFTRIDEPPPREGHEWLSSIHNYLMKVYIREYRDHGNFNQRVKQPIEFIADVAERVMEKGDWP